MFFCPLVVGHAATTTSTTNSKPTRADNAGHTPKPKAATRCVATHTRPPQTRRVRATVVVVWSLGPGTLIPDGSRQLMLPILQISVHTLPSLPHHARTQGSIDVQISCPPGPWQRYQNYADSMSFCRLIVGFPCLVPFFFFYSFFFFLFCLPHCDGATQLQSKKSESYHARGPWRHTLEMSR